jgi:C4-type Zn-finger protein
MASKKVLHSSFCTMSMFVQVLARAEAKKQDGTNFFKRKEYADACEAYEEALEHMAFLADGATTIQTAAEHAGGGSGGAKASPLEGDEKEQRDKIKLSCALNAALCHLKLEAFNKAAKVATTALSVDPDNVKGLFRRGTAYFKVGKFSDAKADLLKAAELDPSNKEVLKMLHQMRDAKKEQSSKAKSNFGGFLDKTGMYEEKKQIDASSCPACGSEGLKAELDRSVAIQQGHKVSITNSVCSNCGWKGQSVAFPDLEDGAKLPEVKYTLSVTEAADLDRMFFRTRAATTTLAEMELEFQLPTSSVRGSWCTIKSFVEDCEKQIGAKLGQYTGESLKTVCGIVEQLGAMSKGERLPFTITLQDPSGYSFVESRGDSDLGLKIE